MVSEDLYPHEKKLIVGAEVFVSLSCPFKCYVAVCLLKIKLLSGAISFQLPFDTFGANTLKGMGKLAPSAF